MKKLILLFIVSFSLIGCATTRIEKTADALIQAGGSLYSPPHYMNDDIHKRLSNKNFGAPLDSDGKNLVYECLMTINRNYGKYIDVLTLGRAGVNVLYDSVTLGLSGAATVLTPVTTKTVLSGLSTFFQGQKHSLDKNLFDDKVIFALTSIMEVRRSEVLQKITRKLAATDTDKYLLGEALLDLESLYRAGSLQTALQAAFLNQPQPVTEKEGQVDTIKKQLLLPSTVTPDK